MTDGGGGGMWQRPAQIFQVNASSSQDKTKMDNTIFYQIKTDSSSRILCHFLDLLLGHSAYFNTAVTKQDFIKILGVSS